MLASMAAVAALLLLLRSFFVADYAADYRTAAVVVLAIGLFATHALPEYVTSLLILFLAIILQVAPPQVVFSGFAVGGLWLLFSGIIIGAAVAEVGLGRYIAHAILGRFRLTYVRAVVLLVLCGVLLAFLMPATIPRIIIMMPIALGLAQAMGFEESGPGYTGLAIAVGAGTCLPPLSIMTANLPVVVHVGAIESVYGLTVSYAQYFLYHFPVGGLLRIVGVIGFLILFFRQTPKAIEEEHEPEKLDSRQRRVLLVLAGALLMWMTDFLHHIAPAWVSLGAAVLLLWPSMGVFGPTTFRDRVQLAPVIYLAGILSIGAIMTANGLDKVLGSYVVQTLDLQPNEDFLNYYATIGVSIVMCLIVTQAAVPVLLVPLAEQISAATDMSLMAVLMTQVTGFSIALFPYQVPPLVVTLSLCRISVLNLTKVVIAMAILMLIVGAPLNYLWWKALGLF